MSRLFVMFVTRYTGYGSHPFNILIGVLSTWGAVITMTGRDTNSKNVEKQTWFFISF